MVPITLALLGLAAIELVFQEGLSAAALLPGVILAAGLLLAQAGLSLSRRPVDPLMLPVAAALTALGLVMARRLAPDLLWPQTAWALMGLGVMLAVVVFLKRPSRLRRYKYLWVLLGLSLVLLTLILGVAPSGSGPRLWLTLGDFYFQPSELLKVLLVIFFAGYLAERRELLTQASTRVGPLRLPPLAYVGPLLVMWGLSMALLVWQRDLGTALLFLGIFLALLYVASGRLAYIIGGLLLFVAGAGAAYVLFDHVRVRIHIWLNPWAQSQGAGYQVVQSLIALAAGGLFGTGLGRGYPGYIPAVHTDFVFAALGEELGLAGLVAVLALYVLLVGRGIHITLRTGTVFEALLAAGLTSILGLQTLIIVAGVLRIVPLTGITLPFVSYGGSSLLTNYLIVGLLLRLSARSIPGPVDAELNRRVRRLAAVLLTGLVVLAAALPYWQIWHAPGLLARPDNPRRVEMLRRAHRGRILAPDGQTLAYTEFDETGLARRIYTYPLLASTIGYASWQHGSAGLERILDDVLMGRARPATHWDRWWDGVLGRPVIGDDTPVVLSPDLQQLADEALGDRAGAVLILDADDGRVLALASHPTFDPNRLPVGDAWDALGQDPQRPMLNRAAEGLYPTGPLAQIVTLAAALDAGLVDPARPLTTTATFAVDGVTLTCPRHTQHDTLTAALADGCPTTFGQLGLTVGADRWTRMAEQLGWSQRPPFELPTLAGHLVPHTSTLTDPATLARAAAGDGPVITPLQAARLILALVAGGTGQPHLLPDTSLVESPTIAPATRIAMQHALTQAAAHQGALLGQDAVGLLATAPTSASDQPDAWFVGWTPAIEPRYVIIVLVEQAGPAPATASPIARIILEALARYP
ncbi:MAG: FtsW/RodA/SpoVE family cell cycle protein [Chloroflexi bacterium]|nr:FtsW/RodA/SpoVE family cell cycle protein [Chloroflexota bacterium]